MQDFPSATDVGIRRVPAEEDAGGEASEWELRECREREEEREAEVDELGAAGELGAGRSRRCSCLRPHLWRPQEMSGGRTSVSFVTPFL